MNGISSVDSTTPRVPRGRRLQRLGNWSLEAARHGLALVLASASDYSASVVASDSFVYAAVFSRLEVKH